MGVYMDKGIFRLLTRLFFSVTFTFILVMIWLDNKKSIQVYDKMARAYNVLGSEYVKDSNIIYRTSDRVACEQLEKNKIVVSNNIDDVVNFMVVLKVSKASTINVDYLKYMTDCDVKYLRDSYMYADDYFRYYLLNTYLLNRDEITEVEYLVWLDENSSDEEIAKTLFYNVSVYPDYNF